MLTRMAARQWSTSKKNGRIMIGHYLNSVGEPRSEIPHAPCLFLVYSYIESFFVTIYRTDNYIEHILQIKSTLGEVVKKQLKITTHAFSLYTGSMPVEVK